MLVCDSVCRDDLECLVYCLFEMEHPTLRLPWHRDLTTNEEAKDGWSMRQLERMSKKKEAAWKAACKRVGIMLCVPPGMPCIQLCGACRHPRPRPPAHA